MDATTAALLGAGIAAAAGMGGPLATAWMARRAERQAWERNQRAELYAEMLVWSHGLDLWRYSEYQRPFPRPPSESVTARAQFLAHAQVRLAWTTLTMIYQSLRDASFDQRSPDDMPAADEKAVKAALDGLLNAIRADRLLQRTP